MKSPKRCSIASRLGIPILTRTNVTDISRLPDGSFRLSAANPKHQPAEPIQAKTL
jgi:hypothetical protein